jgi:hypothetical protein
MLGAVLPVAAGPVWAAAGKAVFVTGPVSLEREQTLPLKVNDPVQIGDIVVTGQKARAQLLMGDATKVALRSGSRFRIDEFSLPPAVNAPAEGAVVKTDGRNVASLLKGGFRTQTGSIGNIDNSAYEVRTPIGTLGIRGTDYTAVFCAGDCTDAPGLAPGAVVRDGLYLHVTAGRIVFRGGNREIEVGAGETVFIPLSGQRPEPLQNPPAFLLEDGAGPLRLGVARAGAQGVAAQVRGLDSNRRGPQSAGDARPDPAATPGADAVRRPVTATDPNGNPADVTGGNPVPQRRDISFAIPQILQPGDFAAVESNAPANYDTAFSGDLTRFAQDLARGSGALAGIDIGTATVAESGALAGTTLRWGRWSGGAITISLIDQTFTESLAQSSLHWIDSGNAATPPQMPVTGAASYVPAGNTSPTDNAGNTGVLNAASFNADFTAQIVTSTLDLTVNALNWVVTGTGTIGNVQLGEEPHQFSGSYSGAINPIQGAARGTFAGFFSQGSTTMPTVPGAVGLTYSLIDETDTLQVNGAVALRNP